MTVRPIVTIEHNSDKTPAAPIQTKWWDLKKKENAHESIFAVVRAILKAQDYRRLDNLRFMRLYSNTDFNQFITGAVAQYFGKKISLNVSRAVVDTATARIGKSKPRPYFLTEGGNSSQQNRAKKLTKFIEGLFYREEVYPKGKQAFVDAGVFGTGCIHVYSEHGKTQFERVFIDEIIVDDIDGRDGFPRQMHRRKIAPREVLIDLFPKSAKEIRAITPYTEINKGFQSAADVVEVVESWHLPSGPDQGDGKHVISIETETLLDEEYDKTFFPFAFLQWSPGLLGFWGTGLVTQVVGIQLEINLMLQRIKEALELVAIPRIFVEETSNVNSSHLTDEIGGIVKYRGNQPIFHTPTGMNRETYEHLEYLYRKAFEETGVSQLSATSKKPAGLDSSVALRTYQDIETERFALIAERYQNFYLDIAKLAIECQRDISKTDKNSSINVARKGFIETIKWKDVELDDDSFVMKLYPTNFLPSTPEGKLSFTQELIQSGFIEPSEGLSLLDFPDLEGFFSLRTAAIDDIKMIMEEIVEKGNFIPPEPYMDLQQSIKIAQSEYLRGKVNKVSEDRLELLRRFISQCQELLKQIQNPAGVAQDNAAQANSMGSPNGMLPNNAPGVTGKPGPRSAAELMPIPQRGIKGQLPNQGPPILPQ